jgi:hypothetical protein
MIIYAYPGVAIQKDGFEEARCFVVISFVLLGLATPFEQFPIRTIIL